MSGKLHILQHCLGLDQFGQGESYRNHFATGPGSVDHPLCEELLRDGLMTVRRQPAGYGGMDFFFVTDAGRAFVAEHSPVPPKLSAGARRYREFLDVSDMTGETFIQFLKRKGARAA